MGRYGVLGSTIFPTLMFYWYKFLDGQIVGTKPKIIVAKVLIDFIATMPIIIVIFYTGMSAMEGREDIFKGFYGLQCARFLYISLDKKDIDNFHISLKRFV